MNARLVAALIIGAGLASIALVSACHEPFDPGQTLVAEVAGGNVQQGTVAEVLQQPLAVRVKDPQGRVVYGVTVDFEVTSGGGTVEPASSLIGSSGQATTRWTLGTSTAESHSVVARVVDPRSGGVANTVTFGATPLPGPAVALVKVSGDSQIGAIGGQLSQPLTVQSQDRYGNGVPGRTVTWSLANAALGGGLTPVSALTGAGGLARTTWTLGPRIGTTFGARAAAAGLTVVPFTATSSSTLPATANIAVLGDAQRAMVGMITAESVGVQVSVSISADTTSVAYIAGLPVSFTVTSGGGSITPSTVSTDLNGVARARWTVGASPGTNVARATMGGRSMSITAVAVDPTLTVLGDSQTAFVGTSPVESVGVRVTADCCAAVAGATVTFAVLSGGGSISASTVSSDGSGYARTRWILGGTTGINTVTATVGARSVILTARAVQPVAVAAIATGGSHSCAITASGTAYCWGRNAAGQLGDGTTTNRTSAVAVVGGPALTSLSGGTDHTCGLDAAGAAYCWGRNVAGQLGDGTTTSRSVPAAVAGAPPLTALAAGAEHTCGLTAAGAAYCWGDNSAGQLGDSTRTTRTQPVAVAGGLAFTKLVAGLWHTCALTAGGVAYCWGMNGVGQLGASANQTCALPTGSSPCSLTPVAVATTLALVEIAGGAYHACGLTSSGSAYCWGEGSESLEGLPSQPALSRLASGFGWGRSCAVTLAGQAYCWDVYWYGYYGYRWISGAYEVGGGLSFDGLGVGSGGHLCSTATGTRYPYCWGNNDAGQLGDGSSQYRALPSPVALPTP